MNKGMIKRIALGAMTFTLGLAIVPSKVVTAQNVQLETVVDNEGTPISGGVLKYALVGDAFSGVLNNMYAQNSPDLSIVGFFNPGLYGSDENYLINDSGFAKLTFDQENKKVTIKIPENTKWDDGEPLTIDDVIYPYYVVGHKDYTGVRYGSDFKNVVGMEEYHEGKSEEISGIKKVDDWTAEITFKEFSASMLQAGGGVSSYIEPKHILEKIPIAEQEESSAVRQTPVGFGPFKVKSITPGESVVYEANEYYYKGKPKLDGVQLDVVNASTATSEMKAGNYDYASLPADQYSTFKDATNFKILGRLTNIFSYIGFHMGKWNAEKKEVETDTNAIVYNKALRQAMGYALDSDSVGEKFYEGLRPRANTTIPKVFQEYNDASNEGYTYQPEKAKQILADAGYADKDGDGYVEDPNGNAFTLKFLAMSGSDVAEPIAAYYIEAWKNIGVHVELVDGRLYDLNSFYTKLDNDEEVDVFAASFATGGDPDPSVIFGRTAEFNSSRWATEENDALLKAITSDAAFDPAVRKETFYKWQAYMTEEAPVIPTNFRYELVAVNNRVKHFDFTRGSDFGWEQVELTADSPAK